MIEPVKIKVLRLICNMDHTWWTPLSETEMMKTQCPYCFHHNLAMTYVVVTLDCPWNNGSPVLPVIVHCPTYNA